MCLLLLLRQKILSACLRSPIQTVSPENTLVHSRDTYRVFILGVMHCVRGWEYKDSKNWFLSSSSLLFAGVIRDRKQSLLCKKIIAFLELCPGSWRRRKGVSACRKGPVALNGEQEDRRLDPGMGTKMQRSLALISCIKESHFGIENKAIMWSEKHDQSQRGGQEPFGWCLSLFLNLEISSTFHHQCQTFLRGMYVIIAYQTWSPFLATASLVSGSLSVLYLSTQHLVTPCGESSGPPWRSGEKPIVNCRTCQTHSWC